MFKSNFKKIAITFILLVISLIIMKNYNYAKNVENSEISDWKIAITSDTKDLVETQRISFQVKDSPNVAKGKIAPGTKAVAKVEINMVGTKVPVDIMAMMDDTKLSNSFKRKSTINGEKYQNGDTKTFELDKNTSFTESNGIVTLELELEWISDDALDNEIVSSIDKIEIPVTIKVMQHI